MNEDRKSVDWKKFLNFPMLILFLYVLMFLPFWEAILVGFIFSSACAPLLNRLRRKLHTQRSKLAYGLVGVTIMLLVTIVTVLSVQSYSALYDLFQKPETLGAYSETVTQGREQLMQWLHEHGLIESNRVRTQVDQSLATIATSAKGFVLGGAQKFLASAPEILLEIFIFLLAFSAFLVMGPQVWNTLSRIFNVGPEVRSRFPEFEQICAVSLGALLITGAIQAVLVTLGAGIAGYQNFVILFIVTFIFSLIPILGAGMLPTFLAVIELLKGNSSTAIVLIVTALIAGSADNVLRAWLFSKAAKTNPAISLISLLGAIALIGFPGLLIAPVLEQMVMAAFFPENSSKKSS